MTTLTVTLPAGSLILETEHDPMDANDFLRQYCFGDLPAKDDRFDAVMKIMKEALRANGS